MRRLAVVLAVTVVIASSQVVATSAVARAQQATGSIVLVGQTPFRGPGQPFSLTLRVRSSSPTESLEVAVGMYRRMGSRSEFTNAIDGRLPTRTPTDLIRTPLDAATRDASGDIVITVEPRATTEGVYPARVELRELDGDVVDGFTTFMISVPAAMDSDPLDVAVVLPVHAEPAVRPDLTVAVAADTSERLGEVARVLAARATPLTLAPTAETLEALAASTNAADRDTVSTLARAASGRQVITDTYVPTDITSLLDAGLNGEINGQLDRGQRVISDTLAVTAPSGARVVDERLDQPALATTEDHGVERLVVPDALLEPIRAPNGITLTATFEIATPSGALPAAAADAGLSAHFERDVAPALGASQLLADLAVLWLDRPGRAATRRGVVVLPSRDWEPDAAFLDTFLGGFGGNPILEPVGVDDFFGAVGPVLVRRNPLRRTFVDDRQPATISGAAVRSTRSQLEGFGSVVAEDNPGLDVLDRALLVAQSSDLSATDRGPYLRNIRSKIRDELGQISMPVRRSITLTAREGELPVTITSTLPYPTTVILSLESDTLDFPQGSTRTVELTHENTTERFQVEARGSGSFPVRVEVTSPQGQVTIAESRFNVRSTAVSGVGIALSVGAAAFLVAWWASHLRGRRRAGRAEPATT